MIISSCSVSHELCAGPGVRRLDATLCCLRGQRGHASQQFGESQDLNITLFMNKMKWLPRNVMTNRTFRKANSRTFSFNAFWSFAFLLLRPGWGSWIYARLMILIDSHVDFITCNKQRYKKQVSTNEQHVTILPFVFKSYDYENRNENYFK